MKRLIAEWLWRTAMIAALCWIGVELHQLRRDVQPTPDEQTTASDAPDPLEQGIADLREDVAGLTQKVDAILMVMAQTR